MTKTPKTRHCGNCGLGLATRQTTATCPRCGPVPVKFWSRLFCPAGSPTPCYQIKADAMRDRRTGAEYVEVEWARWADLSNTVRHTFHWPDVFRLVVEARGRNENWRLLFAAMLAELGLDPFAGRLEEVIRFAGANG